MKRYLLSAKMFGFCMLLLHLHGCTVSHIISGASHLKAGEYQEAIAECESALKSNQEGRPFTITLYGKQVNADYASRYCLGIAYGQKGNYEKAEDNLLKSIQLFPEAAYQGYIALAELNYMKGNLPKANYYSVEASKTVGTPQYYRIQELAKFPPEMFKNTIEAARDFYEMRLLFKKLNNQMQLGNYESVIKIGNQIINKEYKVYLGAAGFETTVDIVSPGGMADLNGIVKGDKLIAINGVHVETQKEAMREADKVLTQYGSTVRYKIQRKDRILDLEATMVYPEIDQTKTIMEEARLILEGKLSRKRPEETEGPWVKILEPKTTRGIKIVEKQKANFVILASGKNDIRDVTVNNVRCVASEASVFEKTFLPGNVKKYTATLPLVQGSNEFAVRAFDAKDNSVQEKVELQGDDKLKRKLEKIYDHKIAVVIGINKYSPWPGLEYAVKDAEAVRDTFKKMGYDKTIELYDRQATRSAINRVLGDDLLSMLGSNDSLIVYFAGHGATESLPHDEEEGYIIPADGSTDNYRGTAISMTQIHELIKKYRAKHILFVFDSCYSGLGLKRGGGQRLKGAFVMNMAKKQARQIITAGGKNEQAQEARGHGVFTKSFIDALNNRDENILVENEYILASDLGQFLRKKVGEKTNFSQTPLYGWLDGEGDFIFEINQ